MRIKAAALVILFFGAFLSARLLLPDRALTSAQIEAVHGICPECHGEVPEYESAAKPHRQHSSFECVFCHRDQAAMRTADGLHRILSRLGGWASLLVLIGIAVNVVAVQKKRRRG